MPVIARRYGSSCRLGDRSGERSASSRRAFAPKAMKWWKFSSFAPVCARMRRRLARSRSDSCAKRRDDELFPWAVQEQHKWHRLLVLLRRAWPLLLPALIPVPVYQSRIRPCATHHQSKEFYP